MFGTGISGLIFKSSSFIIHQLSSTWIMSPKSTGSTNDANVSGTFESRVPAETPAPASLVHSATPCHTNFLFSSRCIAGSDISARLWEATAKEPLKTIEKPDVRNVSLPLDRARPARVTVSLSLHENNFNIRLWQRGSQPMSNSTRLDIGRVRLVNNHFVRTAFIANQKGAIQVLSSLPCVYLCFANCPKVLFVDVFARCLFATQTPHCPPLVIRPPQMSKHYEIPGSLIEQMSS